MTGHAPIQGTANNGKGREDTHIPEDGHFMLATDVLRRVP
jgi:hypothetical protein